MHRVDIMEYLRAKNTSCKPSHEWWVVIIFVENVSAAATATFKQLQRDDAFISEQRQALANLLSSYQEMVNANGPLTSGQRADFDADSNVVSLDGLHAAQTADMITSLENMTGFVLDRMQDAGQVAMDILARNLGKGLLNLIAGLDQVVADRNKKTAPPWIFCHRFYRMSYLC